MRPWKSRALLVIETCVTRVNFNFNFLPAQKTLVRKHCTHALALWNSYAAYNDSCSSCGTCQPLPVVQENWYRRLPPLPAPCVLQSITCLWQAYLPPRNSTHHHPNLFALCITRTTPPPLQPPLTSLAAPSPSQNL